MDTSESELETLEQAMRLFFQTMKRPQHWSRLTALAGVRIDRPAAIILQALTAHQGGMCRVHDLAAQLGIEAPSVTRKTQELEQAGYLRRLPNPRDRRVIDLQVTSSGRALARRLRKAQRSIISQALESWQPSDRKQFSKLFHRFSSDIAAPLSK